MQLHFDLTWINLIVAVAIFAVKYIQVRDLGQSYSSAVTVLWWFVIFQIGIMLAIIVFGLLMATSLSYTPSSSGHILLGLFMIASFPLSAWCLKKGYDPETSEWNTTYIVIGSILYLIMLIM